VIPKQETARASKHTHAEAVTASSSNSSCALCPSLELLASTPAVRAGGGGV
jgi:hypothetical protein